MNSFNKQNNNYLAETELIFEFYIILFLTTDLHQTQVRSLYSHAYIYLFQKTEFPIYKKRIHVERGITDSNTHFQISRNERTRNHFGSLLLFLHSHVFNAQIRIACSFLYGSKKNLTPETNAEVQHPENNIKSKFLGSDVR